MVVGFLGFAPYSGDLIRCPYLLGKCLEIIYSWDTHQLPPPIRHVHLTAPPTQSSSHIWSLGAPTRDHSPLPPAWWLAPIGSALCLAPDWGLQRDAQLLGLLPMSTLGHGRWPINVVWLDWVLGTGLGYIPQLRPYGIFDSAHWTFFLTGPCFGNSGSCLASS